MEISEEDATLILACSYLSKGGAISIVNVTQNLKVDIIEISISFSYKFITNINY